MVYLKSVENVITYGKLIGLLFLFCLPLLSILFLKTKRNDLARPVMGTIFLVLILRINCTSVAAIAQGKAEWDYYLTNASFQNCMCQGVLLKSNHIPMHSFDH